MSAAASATSQTSDPLDQPGDVDVTLHEPRSLRRCRLCVLPFEVRGPAMERHKELVGLPVPVSGLLRMGLALDVEERAHLRSIRLAVYDQRPVLLRIVGVLEYGEPTAVCQTGDLRELARPFATIEADAPREAQLTHPVFGFVHHIDLSARTNSRLCALTTCSISARWALEPTW